MNNILLKCDASELIGEHCSLASWFESQAIKIKQNAKIEAGLGTALNGRKVFVKRYFTPHVWNKLAVLICRDKAHHALAAARQLTRAGVTVPEHLGVFRDFSGRQPSVFLVCQALTGYAGLRGLLQKKKADHVPDTAALMDCIAVMIARMHRSGMVHGDLKWTNIMIRPGQEPDVRFIDLDHAVRIRFPGKGLYGLDLARFAVDMAENMPSKEAFAVFMAAYSGGTGMDARAVLSAMGSFYKKISCKHKRKYGRDVPGLESLAGRIL